MNMRKPEPALVCILVVLGHLSQDCFIVFLYLGQLESDFVREFASFLLHRLSRSAFHLSDDVGDVVFELDHAAFGFDCRSCRL